LTYSNGAGVEFWGPKMTARLAGVLYWTACCLAVLTLAGFSYKAIQPNAFNPVGLFSVGAGAALVLWLIGLTCKYLIQSGEFVAQAACAACGHTGTITWKKDGASRKLVSSDCFHQLSNDNKVICKRCETALPS